MRRTVLIFRHELALATGRASFFVMALVVPVLALLAIGIGRLVSHTAAPRATRIESIGYVDLLGDLPQPPDAARLVFVRFATTGEATQALVRGDVNEYFVIPSDLLGGGTVQRFTLAKEVTPQSSSTDVLKSLLTQSFLDGRVAPEIGRFVDAPLRVASTRLDATGEPARDQGGLAGAIIPLAFSLLLVLAIVFSSSYLLAGLGEEKENRLMEVLASIVAPRELLMGKILGMGTAGLAQVAVWLASIPLLLHLGSATVGGFVSSMHVPAAFYALGAAYFLGGYLLVGVLCAGVGAISSTVREAQQLSALFTLLPVVPLWAMGLYVSFPDSPVWVVLTIFPLTAPGMALERIGLAEVPPWQLVASLVVLVGSIAASFAVALRVFNAYLLHFGKRPMLRQIIRGGGA